MPDIKQDDNKETEQESKARKAKRLKRIQNRKLQKTLKIMRQGAVFLEENGIFPTHTVSVQPSPDRNAVIFGIATPCFEYQAHVYFPLDFFDQYKNVLNPRFIGVHEATNYFNMFVTTLGEEKEENLKKNQKDKKLSLDILFLTQCMTRMATAFPEYKNYLISVSGYDGHLRQDMLERLDQEDLLDQDYELLNDIYDQLTEVEISVWYCVACIMGNTRHPYQYGILKILQLPDVQFRVKKVDKEGHALLNYDYEMDKELLENQDDQEDQSTGK